MNIKRGEIWLADLDPARGSEQAGFRPVLIFQNDLVSNFTSTILAILLTTNLRRAALPSCVLIKQGDGGLANNSVALCHQLRALDQLRLQRKLGEIRPSTLAEVEVRVLFTLGVTN
jgi:mRNA interferase MazF